MANYDFIHSKWASRFLSILRIAAALMIMQHGSQKLFGFPAAPAPAGAPPAQEAFSLISKAGIAGVLELFGGFLLLLGLFTRPVALILSGLLAVAYFMAHAPQGFWPVLNKGELAALYSYVFLYLAVAGGGSWSVDYCLWGRGDGAVVSERAGP